MSRQHYQDTSPWTQFSRHGGVMVNCKTSDAHNQQWEIRLAGRPTLERLTSQVEHGGLLLEDALHVIAQARNLLRVQEERAILRRLPLPRVQQLPQHHLTSAVHHGQLVGFE